MKKITFERRESEDRRASRRAGIDRRAGEHHPKAILTDREVELLRYLRENEGWTYNRLAAKFEVSKSHVARLCKYRCR